MASEIFSVLVGEADCQHITSRGVCNDTFIIDVYLLMEEVIVRICLPTSVRS